MIERHSRITMSFTNPIAWMDIFIQRARCYLTRRINQQQPGTPLAPRTPFPPFPPFPPLHFISRLLPQSKLQPAQALHCIHPGLTPLSVLALQKETIIPPYITLSSPCQRSELFPTSKTLATHKSITSPILGWLAPGNWARKLSWTLNSEHCTDIAHSNLESRKGRCYAEERQRRDEPNNAGLGRVYDSNPTSNI